MAFKVRDAYFMVLVKDMAIGIIDDIGDDLHKNALHWDIISKIITN
jgi:hypothetical protein